MKMFYGLKAICFKFHLINTVSSSEDQRAKEAGRADGPDFLAPLWGRPCDLSSAPPVPRLGFRTVS